ncbi:HD domain-containing protein [Nocardia blacklockiae]|uniref:HD domain-containing protein n=1 Tax=Nocardia blacklockiae TaxID=480036 RepID=UPI001895C72A|nr:HD domain-containing protein [Nocardia blacklockiae]MBF6171094.1 HD domain-containing protein [Nocardia blacklockiae]
MSSLGLLAVQIVVAERLPALAPRDEGSAAADSGPVAPAHSEGTDEGVEWTAELAERILRAATADSIRLVRALVTEGGSASLDRLDELTGGIAPRPAVLSLNSAARHEGIRYRLPERRLIQAFRGPNSAKSKVVAYALPDGSLPAFAAAIGNMAELHRRFGHEEVGYPATAPNDLRGKRLQATSPAMAEVVDTVAVEESDNPVAGSNMNNQGAAVICGASADRSDPVARTTVFAYELGYLKLLSRSGWRRCGIRDGEDVAGHSWRAAILSYAIAVGEGADPEHAAVLALFHDMHEARSGDPDAVTRLYNDTTPPAEIVADQTEGLPDQLARRIRAAVDEHESAKTEQATLEARCSRDADKLELLMQAREYQEAGRAPRLMQRYIDSMIPMITTPTGKALRDSALSAPPSTWWDGLARPAD